MNFVRYPFFLVNFLFLIFGIGIMAFGILLLTNYSIVEEMLAMTDLEKSENFTESYYRASPEVPIILQPSPAPRWLARIRDPASYLLIAFGAFYFTLSFVGYCGSVKDSRGLMVIYGVLLVILFILQIVGVCLYMKYKPDLKSEVASEVNRRYQPEEMQKFTKFEFIMDLLMINWKCCGVNNERDFKGAYAHFYSVRSLPIDPRSNYGNAVHEQESQKIMELIGGRVITGNSSEEPSMERQVPVSCCKLNVTRPEAVKLLRNIYKKQEDKLQLLAYAIDDQCVTKPDETNAYVGDSHGCFDKIQGEISTPLMIGVVALGMIQLCGLVVAGFIFKTAYYDWLG